MNFVISTLTHSFKVFGMDIKIEKKRNKTQSKQDS